MTDLAEQLRAVFSGPVTFVGEHSPDDLHDESLHPRARTPFAVARPRSRDEVVALVTFADRHDLPITARGSGTGLSGGATPVEGGLVICFDQMNRVLSVDVDDHVAVVEPGLTLAALNGALAGSGLHYPVYPGETSGSLGGNVNTNAGGMRAVRHGVTRHHVLGLELVLADGRVVRTGGPVTKTSSGYDLTQLVVGSEGTLALVTEVTLKLSPVLTHSATLLAPFASLEPLAKVVPALIASGLAPSILEYVDALAMASLTRAHDVPLGVPDEVARETAVYLLVVLETRTAEQLESDLALAHSLVDGWGALDLYVLDGANGHRLIEAREKAFWGAKVAGANDIIDVVVPRSRVPWFVERAQALAGPYGAFVTGCGHVGDGNVHLSLFCPDDEKRDAYLLELFRVGVELGGAVTGEHALGIDKRRPYLALADPTLVELQRAIKRVFDPKGLLNPYRHVDPRDDPAAP